MNETDATLDDFRPENVGSILCRRNWAIISAHIARDPFVTPGVWAAVNRDRTMFLADRLRREFGEPNVWAVTGTYGGVQEESFLVLHADFEKVFVIGALFRQESVLMQAGLVYRRRDAFSPREVDPAVGVNVLHVKKPTQDHTRVHATGCCFSVLLASQSAVAEAA